MLIESRLSKWLVPSGARFLAAGVVVVGAWSSDEPARHAHHQHLRAVATPTPAAVAPAPTAVAPAPTAAAIVATPSPAATRAAAQATATPTATATATATATPTSTPPPCAYEDATGCVVPTDKCTFIGTLGDDVFTGDATAELICGFDGNDVLDGGGGDDTILGGAGDDTISGGPGRDCLVGGPGSDSFPDAAAGDIVGQDTLTTGTIGPDGRCVPPPTPTPTPTPGGCPGGCKNSPGTGSQQGEQSSDLTAPAQTGSLALSIAQALQNSAPDVSLGDGAKVKDGVANVFISCATPVSGTLVLVVKHGKKQQRAGSAPFTCDPPSTLAKVKLTKAARGRLHDAGTLTTTAKVKVNDTEVAQEKLVLTEATG